MTRLRVALLFNLKKNAPRDPDAPPDALADLDSEHTILAIREALQAAGHTVIPLEGDITLWDALRREQPDICFNICEGHRGDSREAQAPALLEMLGIPYSGSRVLTHAISLDKAITKRLLRDHGLPTAPFQLFERAEEPLSAELRAVGFPLFVKPNAEGTGMGINPLSVVHTEEELRLQVRWVMENYRQPALVEPYLPGREITVGILGNVDLHVFPPLEIDLSPIKEESRGIYGSYVKSELYAAPRYLCPAPLDSATVHRLSELAVGAYRALKCLDVSRIDFRVDEEGRAWILEVNTLPGLSPGVSDLVMMAEAEGMSHAELIYRILTLACERYGISTDVWQPLAREDGCQPRQGLWYSP